MVLESDIERAQPDGGSDLETQPSPHRVSIQYGQRHLQGRADERHLPHRFQFLERKLQPQREKQERYPDLRQQFDIVNVGIDQVAGVRADQDARQNVSQDDGLFEPLEENRAEQRGHDDDDDIRG